jgi:hypothetical protein
MTKSKDLANLGGGFTQAGAGAVQRTVNNKLRDVVSPKDFGAIGNGVADDTAAIQAALNSLEGNGTLVLDGHFRITSKVIVNNVEFLTLRGDKTGIIQPSGSSAGFEINLKDTVRRVNIYDLNIFPSGTTVDVVFKITVPFAGSVAYTNFIANNVTCIMNNPNPGGVTATANCLFELINIWAPRVTNCVFFAQTKVPADEGTAMFRVSDVVDMTFIGCIQHFGDCLVYQTGYCEGMNLNTCTIVGCNHVIRQKAGIVPRFGPGTAILYQLQVVACECSTRLGSFKLRDTVHLLSINCAHTNNTFPGFSSDWNCYDLTDCQYTCARGDFFIGGGSPAPGAVRNCIKITRGTGLLPQFNGWFAPGFRAVDSIAQIGAGVASTQIIDGQSALPPAQSNFVTDLGTNSLFSINGEVFGGLSRRILVGHSNTAVNPGVGNTAVGLNLEGDPTNGGAILVSRPNFASIYVNRNTDGESLILYRSGVPVGSLSASSTGATFNVNGNQVVGSRKTGWTPASGSSNKGSFDTATVTTEQLAERVKAILDDLTSHGLIGN